MEVQTLNTLAGPIGPGNVLGTGRYARPYPVRWVKGWIRHGPVGRQM